VASTYGRLSSYDGHLSIRRKGKLEMMGGTTTPLASVATIAAMVTPALLILGSASLIATALVRMARVVDRARGLAMAVHEGTWSKLGLSQDELGATLERHAKRARYAERSIALLYAAVVVFIATCLAIAFEPWTSGWFGALPVLLAIAGTLLLLAGGGWMFAESRLSGEQIADEIRRALFQLGTSKP
jgi:hypothetical protein